MGRRRVSHRCERRFSADAPVQAVKPTRGGGRIALMLPLLHGARLAALIAASFWIVNAPMSALAESPLALLSSLVSEGGIERQSGVAYGSSPRHRLDVYRGVAAASGPNKVHEKQPIVIFFYGGSWKAGERGTYRFVGSALAARGITTVIPDYRLFPDVRFPGFMEDAALAYRWAADNLATACTPIIIAGHSAGAHIAALLALDPRYRTAAAPGRPLPAGWIGLAGPYAFDPTTWASTRDIFSGVSADRSRPVTFVGAQSPPALVMHGRDDTVVRMFNQRDLETAYRAAGVPIETRELDGIAHIGIVLAVSRPFRWRAPVLDDMVRFVEQRAAGSGTGCGQATAAP